MDGASRRRRTLIILGTVCIVAGIVGAAVLWVAAEARRSDAIADFARAPVGCDTTVDFAESGDFVLYIESAGRLDDIRGDCDAAAAYDAGTAQPDAEIAVVDPDGVVVELDSVAEDIEYDADGFVGRSAFRVEIADAADHIIRVESPEDVNFAVAIGRDPSNGVTALRVGAVVAAIAGLVIGLGLIVAGRRRRAPVVSSGPEWAPTPTWQPGAPYAGQRPAGPPPMGPPVYGQPQGPPAYRFGPPVGSPPPPPPSPSRFDPPQQWRPPRPPTSAPAAAPQPPRIPGQPDLSPQSSWSNDDDDAVTQDRQSRTPEDDPHPIPPPE